MNKKEKWSKKKFEKYIKEGRGSGEKENYKPWIDTYVFASKGRSTRVYGVKTNRVHYFNSDLTTNFFYLLHWDDSVSDIREAYPLIDAFDLLNKEKDLRFDLFRDKINKEQYILTTSFLITIIENNVEKVIARSLRLSEDLERKLVIEKLEIERRYWIRKGIEWGLVTEKDIPIQKSKNIRWVYTSLFDKNKNDIQINAEKLLKFLSSNKVVLRKSLQNFDKKFQLDEGTGIYLFKYIIASKMIHIDMAKEIDLNKYLDELIIK